MILHTDVYYKKSCFPVLDTVLDNYSAEILHYTA